MKKLDKADLASVKGGNGGKGLLIFGLGDSGGKKGINTPFICGFGG